MSDHTPFVPGEHFRPGYYCRVRHNPRIAPDADIHDVVHAFGVDDPLLAQAVQYLVRAGRKPGESRAKDVTKAAELLQRALSFEAMRKPVEVDELDVFSEAVRGAGGIAGGDLASPTVEPPRRKEQRFPFRYTGR